MKILALNSSYRGVHGLTQNLIDRLFEGAREAGAECETIVLASLRIHRCLGCNQCQNNARPLSSCQPGTNIPDCDVAYEVTCVLREKDDVGMIFEKMRQADLIIYATPIYVFSMSALLKTLLERYYGACYSGALRATRSGLMFHTIDDTFMSTPFVLLSVCDNLENETPRNVIEYFKTYSRFMDAAQVGTLVRNGGVLFGHGNDPGAEGQLPRLSRVYAAYHQAGSELGLNGRISRATQRNANQEIIDVPFFSLLKRIENRMVKQKFVERAKKMHLKGKPDRED